MLLPLRTAFPSEQSHDYRYSSAYPDSRNNAGAAPDRFSHQRHAHCGITRLVSPSDIGGLIKPFVFLDHAVVVPTGKPMFGFHPLLAHYSVHTSNDALAQGESEIRRIGRDLAARRRNGSARNA